MPGGRYSGDYFQRNLEQALVLLGFDFDDAEKIEAVKKHLIANKISPSFHSILMAARKVLVKDESLASELLRRIST